MIVYIVAAAQLLFYLFAIPVNLALRLEGLRGGAGISAFTADVAREKARSALARSGGGGGSGLRTAWPVLRRLYFERIELTGAVSLGDAAATAMLCGGLNGLGRSLRGRAAHLRVAVRPDFSSELHLELRGMVCARSGQIMLAVIRSQKGRIQPWKSIRLKAS